MTPIDRDKYQTKVTLSEMAEHQSVDALLFGEEESLLEGVVMTGDGDPIPGASVELRRRDARSFNSLDLDYGHAAPRVASPESAR